MKENRRIAIVPGSCDPITVGHLDLIQRAKEQYDEVIVAVMINPQKQYLFSMQERKAIAEAAVKEIQGVRVISSEGMLWQLAKEEKACAIVKGYRNQQDYDYEMNMAKFNQAQYPQAQTVLLPSDGRWNTISSTKVRAALSRGEDVSAFVPAAALSVIQGFLSHS